MKQTAFAKWLEREGVKPYQFAQRYSISQRAAYRLAGIRLRYDGRPSGIHQATLEEVSRITGIASQKLYGEAIEAMKEPLEPRKYEKKGGGSAAAGE